jgi:hypothetical protein
MNGLTFFFFQNLSNFVFFRLHSKVFRIEIVLDCSVYNWQYLSIFKKFEFSYV